MSRPGVRNADQWTFDLERRLRAMIRDGMSAGQISHRLGVTRCAVVGKAHRLGLRLCGGQAYRDRDGPHSRKHAGQESMVLTPRKRPDPLLPKPGKCKWPIGEVGDPDFHFCDQARLPDTPEGRPCPYCAEHAARAYKDATPRQSRRRYSVMALR